MDPAIAIDGLTMAYGPKRVLDGIDLHVEPGTILGYIGPNGAGKSTTVKILVGMLQGWQGSVRIAGHDVRADPLAVKNVIGYVPENAVLYDALTIAEFLLLIGRLHRMEDELVEERGRRFLEIFELDARAHSRLATLSKGMRQKVLISAALLANPDVLFFDEPLSGLDVNSSIFIKELLRALADQGRTVFYCSHIMDVVERICDRIVILDDGKLVADGSFEELAASREGGSLERIFADLTAEGGESERVERFLEALQ